MTNSTNFSKASPPSTGFGTRATETGILLLQTGDKLLLQDGVENLLIESGEVISANFVKGSIVSGDFGPRLLWVLLLQNGYELLLQNGNPLFLEEIEGKSLNFAKPSVNSTNFSS